MSKLERIYQGLTGIHPRRDLQPPLLGRQLENAVARLRHGSDTDQGTVFAKQKITGYEILDAGNMPTKGGSEAYTLIGRKLGDGSMQATYVFGACLDSDQVIQLGPTLPRDQWVPYKPHEY